MTITNIKVQRNFINELNNPPAIKKLLGNVKWAWLWFALRVYLGWTWLEAGLGKINNPAWTGSKAGSALAGFAQGALAKTEGAHPDVQIWYSWFLENIVVPNSAVWSYLVAWGEVLVGIALILGIFTGLAAFFGGFMNMNYLLAGTVSTNPVMLFISIILLLAWRTAGWWGLDRFVLPTLGTPWQSGLFFKKNREK